MTLQRDGDTGRKRPTVGDLLAAKRAESLAGEVKGWLDGNDAATLATRALLGWYDGRLTRGETLALLIAAGALAERAMAKGWTHLGERRAP